MSESTSPQVSASAPDGALGSAEIVLRVERVSKTFPGTRALNQVDLSLARGEIHGLVGNNGSGKSTLIKILAGVEMADPGGSLVVGGRTFAADAFNPREAQRARLHFVHQVPALFPWLTVAENLAFGRGFETNRFGRILWSAQNERAARLIERFNIRAKPETPLAALDPADRTLVAIARALQDQEGEHGGVLVLDEPTAALPGPEVERLLGRLKDYAAQGQTILYVSHHLQEIVNTCHRVTVLRDGQNVGTVSTAGLDETQLVSLMLGRAHEAGVSERKAPAVREPVLSLQNVAGGAARDVTLEVCRGEIVGIAGIVGSGAADVLALLFGARPCTGGQIKLNTKPFAPRDPADAILHGLAFLPADRAADASFPSMSIRANLSASRVGRYFKGMRLRHDLEREDARQAIVRFLVRSSSEEQAISTLSGGNQQKVVLARWLHDRPAVFLLNEPTQGVDVHARGEIHELLRGASSQGTTMLVVSSDFSELSSLCDRVLVMAKGKVVAELVRPNLDTHRLTELAHFGES